MTGAFAGGAVVLGDYQAKSERFQEGNLQKTLVFTDADRGLLAERGASMAQITIAWALNRGRPVIPFPGAKRIVHLEDNVKALNIELTAAEVQCLGDAFPQGAAVGGRYRASLLAAWQQ